MPFVPIIRVMPEPPIRSLSPWWALLLLPVGLAAGLGLGQIQPPARDAATPAAPSSGPPARESHARIDMQNQVSAAEGTEISHWTTFDDAEAESNRNGKPILIDFNAEWCGPCQALKRTVFDDASYGVAVQTAVIPVSITDRRREDGANPPLIESLQARYQIDAFPTLIVYSPRTGRTERARGFGGPDQTVSWITDAAKRVR